MQDKYVIVKYSGVSSVYYSGEEDFFGSSVAAYSSDILEAQMYDTKEAAALECTELYGEHKIVKVSLHDYTKFDQYRKK